MFRHYVVNATFRIEDELFVVPQERNSNFKGRELLDSYKIYKCFDDNGELAYGNDNVFFNGQDVKFVLDSGDAWEFGLDEVEKYMVSLEARCI